MPSERTTMGIEVFGRARRSPDFAREPSPPSRLPGVAAVLLVVAAGAAEGLAITLAASGTLDRATLIAVIAIGVSVCGFALGAFAVIRGRGRAWGWAAILLSPLANPFILTQSLTWISGITGS